MEENTKIQSLIDSIKKDGIEASEEEAKKIIEQAKSEAQEIIKEAKKTAETELQSARDRIELEKNNGEKALTQAGRNLLLSIKEQILSLFQKVTELEIRESFSEDILSQCISAVVSKWGENPGAQGLEILLSQENSEKLEKVLLAKLNKVWKSGVEIKPNENIQSGFRIGEKDGNVHYDLTDQGLTEMISEYLNPKMRSLLENTGDSAE